MCGTGYSIAKQNPDTVLPILKLSAASGVTGALLGWGISAYRSSPTHIHVISLGANFAVTSAMFLSKAMLAFISESIITFIKYGRVIFDFDPAPAKIL